MNIVANLTLEALAEKSNKSLEGYADSLCAACEMNPPPYGMSWYGEKYRQVSCDPHWLANSLIANAAKEGEGSRKLWDLTSRTEAPEVADQIRHHAIDESRHARLYIEMLDMAFPAAIDDDFRSTLYALSPGYTIKDSPEPSLSSSEAIVLDELIQMNIGEIRTRIHQLLLRPMILAHCPQENCDRLKRILDSLLADETKHIEYTANLIEEFIDKGHSNFVYQTMQKRLAEFNQITLTEVGELTFDGA
jgi:bacterioferritin (cytochrome b1)